MISLEALFFIYILFGGAGVVGNALILAVGAFKRNMRTKEYHFPYLLALAEFLFAAALFTGGISRASYYYSDYWGYYHPRLLCMIHPHNYFFIMGEALLPMANIAICIDRIIAIAWPMTYYSLTERYTKNVCKICLSTMLVYAVLEIGIAYAEAWNDTKLVHTQCTPTSTFYGPLERGRYFFAGVCGIITTILIVAILILFLVKERSKEKTQLPGIQEVIVKRNERVTKMLIHSLVVSLFCSSIPWSLVGIMVNRKALGIYMTNEAYLATVMTGASLIAVNTMNNVLIYVWKNREVRAIIFGYVGIKTASKTRVAPSSTKPNGEGE